MRALILLSLAFCSNWPIAWAAPPRVQASPAEVLSQPVNFPGASHHMETLATVLEALGKQAGVLFYVNDRAFKFENVMDVQGTQIADPRPVEPIQNTRLATVLRIILARVPAPSGATYLVRRDHIEITTGDAVRKEIFGDDFKGTSPPLVSVHFKGMSLHAALRTIATVSGVNIVLDSRLRAARKRTITARFTNTPIDSAVQVVAEMAGLGVAKLDNVYFVTTSRQATRLTAENRSKRIEESLRLSNIKAQEVTDERTGGTGIFPPGFETIILRQFFTDLMERMQAEPQTRPSRR